MAGSLYNVIEWAKQNGEVKVMDRIRVKVLPVTMKEQIVLAAVTPNTECSPECLDAVRQAVNNIVGKSCPY